MRKQPTLGVVAGFLDKKFISIVYLVFRSARIKPKAKTGGKSLSSTEYFQAQTLDAGTVPNHLMVMGTERTAATDSMWGRLSLGIGIDGGWGKLVLEVSHPHLRRRSLARPGPSLLALLVPITLVSSLLASLIYVMVSSKV